MSQRQSIKHVTFSPIDHIISTPPQDSSSESESEEMRAMIKGLALERDYDVKPSKPSPPLSTGPIPPTPKLKHKELPADDDLLVQTGHRVTSPSLTSSPRSLSSQPSPRSRSASIHSPLKTGTTPHSGNAKAYSPDGHVRSTADDPLTLILSTRLTSGDSYAWDITVDPRVRNTQLWKMLEEEGDLPAAFSAHSQGPYTGELILRLAAIPCALGVNPKHSGEYVTIRDVFKALYDFTHDIVNERDISGERLQMRADIREAAMNRSGSTRPDVRRVDWLLGYTRFRGLSLGKDGETINVLTSSSYRRA